MGNRLSDRDDMQILTDDQITLLDETQLDELFGIAFGGMRFSDSANADLRAVYRSDGQIVAHAAAAIRTVDLHTEQAEVAILGMVCVHPNARGQHLGHQVVTALHRNTPLPFILNCGESLMPYYSNIGYTLIADRASYLRNGEICTDDDPVMLCVNGHGLSTEERSRPIYFGADF